MASMRKSRSSIPMWTCVPKMSSCWARSCRSCLTPMYRSSGVISCVIQLENGCVPSAAILSPWRAADLGAALHHRLVQLQLHLLHHQVVAGEDLGDVRSELARLRIDDLIFFFD